MKLDQLVNPDDLQAAINDKLISIRVSPDGHDRILNYTDAAMYTPGAWGNPAVRTCRGLIVDSEDEVIARPWAKFFNHGQAEAGELDMDAPVEVTNKLDGSLGIIHVDANANLRVATRGSFESEQAIHATQWLRKHGGINRFPLHYITALVEIIYPANRIVCDYGDRDELVLLGAVDIESGCYFGPKEAARILGWQHSTTETFAYATLREALASPPRPGAEGLVVRYLDRPHMVKIKQDDYVVLHRIVTGLSERTVWQHMMDGKPLSELLEGLPDELHPWVHEVHDVLTRQTEHRKANAEFYFDKLAPLLGDRPAFAEQAKKVPEYTPYLFQLLDGRDITIPILKTLKPRGDRRAKHTSEATA